MLKYIKKVASLLNEYRAIFPEDDAVLGFLPQQLAANDIHVCNRKNFSGHLTASALLLNDQEDAALLIKHKFLGRWLQPGGHLDPEEAPEIGAARELLEETGISAVRLHPWHETHQIPLDIDSHFIPLNPLKTELSHYHHDFLFIFRAADSAAERGGKEIGNVTLQDAEVSAFKWHALSELLTGDCGMRLQRVARKVQRIQSGGL